jgi:hypothetical protein
MKLTSKGRSRIPSSKFAGPSRSFPIENKDHARAALADVNRAKGLSSAEKARIRSKARAVLR